MRKMRKQKVLVSTNYGAHLVLVESDEKEGFIVTVPGLPEVITWGKDIAQARAMAKEAIELCVECRAIKAHRNTKPHQRRAARGLVAA